MVMNLDEIKLKRLSGQHLLATADTQTVVKDLCGLQAQFLSHALYGLSIRTDAVNMEGLVKSWTIRGTMHLFSVDDLPLFFHEGRTHFLRPQDTMGTDAYVSAERKTYFADLIVDSVLRGIEEREALKAVCEKAGMSDSESQSLFDPWGGLIRALCETGRICHKGQETKAYRLCPQFEPLAEEQAWQELMRRYFTSFGPATVKDAAYFFGTTQAKVKSVLQKLPVSEMTLDGKPYYYIGHDTPCCKIPNVLFLAGFDQLMLGYEKTESLFLSREHIRDIFTLSGMVRPAVLIDGTVAGRWNRKNKKITITMFRDAGINEIIQCAYSLWPDVQKVEFEKNGIISPTGVTYAL